MKQNRAKSVRSIAQRRNGLSLIEVMLAIALLGTSMAIIHQLISIGYRSAAEAQLHSDAAVLVDCKMAELASGVLGLENASLVPIEEAPDWSYSVQIESSQQIGLLVATVTVERNDVPYPIEISVVRFMPDPEYDPYALEESP